MSAPLNILFTICKILNLENINQIIDSSVRPPFYDLQNKITIFKSSYQIGPKGSIVWLDFKIS